MSSVNVLRYSALALGLAVGLKTDMNLRCSAKKQAEEDVYQKELALVKEAKAEWNKLHPKKVVESKEINLEDPNLDYAAVILNAVESLKST
ncbi:similar to Saccharomyces cerevisiae YDR322C-A TIM11 Subunit e of mitochondrial F1F0-ATPase, which is a large, evolutionarily conserved enzyme complex required for ATP synthesis [Maudiozyma barnettii]|uniref:ATP synthase F(0) complex subunit e, mitochondrial n=1 Tax=Maudiozyma barnettii TaxID=61262 RepID=A0A8H2VES8_9SACH|nr:F1F0 ATP synthase subunit e [Kazachstania barnettii]CAB4253799.1 similar to Saccharomyces cerevisiae YDR322C-A TIM11 Subunit e of mitochondrial F1F0-ATPase, which is a large, evolutionarily conserved enzyme complex required for ATP synthesis [Kazachstania barnettii]CAD1781548.1 similar to Saccharomyces cerevisiae YDR322C-A TIM11 Subunit e of mitochondrial F1F0-ATPase, which is a large, evolutionarily conserved enzyme complex required for ATP synthesis [Kazachstania barnettii]